MQIKLKNTVIRIKKGDITEENCDAIVNAANSSLMGGGGVDGAIHRKAGPKLHEECVRIRMEKYPDGLPPGNAVITNGGNLKARYVIHTVGPVWKGGNHNEDEILRNSFINSLKVADDYNIKRIAFPAISTGIYGYPINMAAEVSLNAIKYYIENYNTKIEEICIVLFTDDIYEEFKNIMEKTMK